MRTDKHSTRSLDSGLLRRDFMKTASATALAVGLAGPAFAQAAGAKRTLIKNAVVLSFDPKVGDFDKADVLIEGRKIAAVRPSIQADGAQTIDASRMIAVP